MSNIIIDIILNESVEDVLTTLAPTSSQPRIDRLYSSYKFEALETGELWNTYEKLIRQGVLATDEKGHTIKGPHWKAPAFITKKKYSFE
ncbi:immunity protein [Pseudomonas fluorescens]|uniref:immunity protein n=1 Tax=Pseudomonas fluorescens TaxID=294 RepID=UPI0012414D72|nr:immunity protein [Pseudomonas fluorescens]